MANLIITIISIALVAVLAIAGIYYGGSAFGESQSTAIANGLNQEAAQISAAINLYMSTTGQDFATQVVNTGSAYPGGGYSEAQVATLLSPNYLSTFPSINNVASSVSYWSGGGSSTTFGWYATSCSSLGSAPTSGSVCFHTPYWVGQIYSTTLGWKVCQKLGMIRRNTTAALDVSTAPSAGPAVDCYVNTALTPSHNLTNLTGCADQTLFCGMQYIFKAY